MTIDSLIALEKQSRKSSKWLMLDEEVRNDLGQLIRVRIKSFGFYNQILKLGDSDINYASGHAITKVKSMHEFLRKEINNANV